MPTLNWIGKEAVLEHHRRVPLRLLECDKELSAGDPDYLIETGMPAPTRPRKDNPLLGVHAGGAVYLLYNGVLGDKRAGGGNVLTHAVLDELPRHPDGPGGPRVIYGEACRLSEATLQRLKVTFRQTPYALREGPA